VAGVAKAQYHSTSSELLSEASVNRWYRREVAGRQPVARIGNAAPARTVMGSAARSIEMCWHEQAPAA